VSAPAQLRLPSSRDMVTHMKTTLEISDPLLERAKRLAADESTTLRELVEAGLRLVMKEKAARAKPFELRDARVDGRGLSPEFETADWGEIRKASYEGRGG
jgi:hypothetical protein